jgi:hypothetical protein
VLPKPDFCATHPVDPLCTVFSPGGGQAGEARKPVTVAQQATVALVNARTPLPQGKLPAGPATSGLPDGGGSAEGNKPPAPSENQSEKPAGPAPGTNPGVKNEKPATKMYCN